MNHAGEDDLLEDGTDEGGLTAAERAELTAAEAEASAPPAPSAAPPPPPEDEPIKPDATAEALQSLAQQQARTADVLAAVANKVLPEQQTQQQEQPPEASTEPDWDAERREIKEKYERGDLDDDQFEAAREALFERKSEWRATETAKALLEQQRKQEEDAAWDRSLNTFLTDENRKFLADVAATAVFNTYLSQVAQNSPGGSYDAMLAEAMRLTRARFGAPQATDPKAAIQNAVDQRRATSAPPDLSRAPQAGVSSIEGDKFRSLDELDIDSLEDRISRMPDAELDEFLATAPGGLLDNPRAM